MFHIKKSVSVLEHESLIAFMTNNIIIRDHGDKYLAKKKYFPWNEFLILTCSALGIKRLTCYVTQKFPVPNFDLQILIKSQRVF